MYATTTAFPLSFSHTWRSCEIHTHTHTHIQAESQKNEKTEPKRKKHQDGVHLNPPHPPFFTLLQVDTNKSGFISQKEINAAIDRVSFAGSSASSSLLSLRFSPSFPKRTYQLEQAAAIIQPPPNLRQSGRRR